VVAGRSMKPLQRELLRRGGDNDHRKGEKQHKSR